MKQIAYIELDTHAEIAGNFMALMQDSVTFKVDYFFSEKIIRLIGHHNSDIYLSENTELLNQLGKKHYDLVIIGTVHRYFNLFKSVAERYNTAVITHNTGFVRLSKSQLFRNIFKEDIIYRLKLWLKEDLLSAPLVYKKAQNLLVLDEQLISQNPDLKLKFLPVFYRHEYTAAEKTAFTIVIPGTVSQKRRDYRHIFKKIIDFQPQWPVLIVFLGKAEQNELKSLQKLENNLHPNVSLKYFPEKVPSESFQNFMMKADVLWCPVQTETSFFSSREVYGTTKMSGNIGDAVKYGKSAVFPPEYKSNLPFIIPENTDVENQLYSLRNAEVYNFKEKFSKEKTAAALEKLLNSLL